MLNQEVLAVLNAKLIGMSALVDQMDARMSDGLLKDLPRTGEFMEHLVMTYDNPELLRTAPRDALMCISALALRSLLQLTQSAVTKGMQ